MSKLQNVISAYIKAEPLLNNTSLAKTIQEEYPELKLSIRTLRHKISQQRLATSINNKPEESEGTSKYVVAGDSYKIGHPRGLVSLKISMVDDIFTDYSKFGNKLTGDEIIAKYDLMPHEWLALKNSMNLYKTSDIVSPHTKENTPKKELEEILTERMDKLFRNKGIINKKYRQTIERGYKAVIQKDMDREGERQQLVFELFENISILSDKAYVNKISPDLDSKTGVVIISDLHFGAHIRQHKSVPQYSMFGVQQALERAAVKINQYGYSKIIVVLLGDLIHTFTGNMHHEMWREVDVQEGIGGKLVINTVDLLSGFLTSIHNIEEVHGVAGNHDRHSPERERVGQELSLIIYEMLKRTVPNIDINFHGLKGMISREGINYILSHGEHGLDNRDVYRMINRFGNPKGFTMVLKGHKHSRMIGSAEDNYDNRRMHCPSFFTMDNYTDSLGFHACAGFLVCESELDEDSGEILPIIHDHSVRIF